MSEKRFILTEEELYTAVGKWLIENRRLEDGKYDIRANAEGNNKSGFKITFWFEKSNDE